MIPHCAFPVPPQRTLNDRFRSDFSRRRFLQLLSATAMLTSTASGPSDARDPGPGSRFEPAIAPLEDVVRSGQIRGAAVYVRQGNEEAWWFFGESTSADDPFLIASITKTMAVAAVLTLVDSGDLDLDRPVVDYLPEFGGQDRRDVKVWQLMTHVSGLPDQVANNSALRAAHAPLSAFVTEAVKAPLAFAPGTAYSYSSMAILLASEIGRRISKLPIDQFVDKVIFKPLEMKSASFGLGGRDLSKFMKVQTEHAAPESGAGSASAKDWDWNSPYWRNLGAPWGGGHASAHDVGRFMWEAMHPSGKVMKESTWRLMTTNQNPAGVTPRGLGFGVGKAMSHRRASPQTFGHTGSTGTIAWADPATDTVCVILTTLPGTAMSPHPRQAVSDRVGEIAGAR